MQKRAPHLNRRFLFVPTVAVVAALLVGCNGYGGGWLPPDGVAFPAQATMGFTFSCERSAKTVNQNPPRGRLHIELAYVERGASPLLVGGFGIHGIADVIDPALQSAVCIGQEPPPGGQTLIFLGRYRLASSAPGLFPTSCATTKWSKSNCRFEVEVRDNDLDRAPSPGDYFSIKLSTVTEVCPGDPEPCITEFPVETVFYARAGLLGGGNVTVTS